MHGATGPIERMAMGLIRLYQLAVSPWFGTACRFTPGCSNYMQEAIRLHGVLRGVWLGARRIARCHPWGGSGYDPVPCARQNTAHIHGARRG